MRIPVDPSTSRRFTPPSTAFPCGGGGGGKMGENSGALSAQAAAGPGGRTRPEVRSMVVTGEREGYMPSRWVTAQ